VSKVIASVDQIADAKANLVFADTQLALEGAGLLERTQDEDVAAVAE
jgi:hypothetical protein